jgi:hypothetical protein
MKHNTQAVWISFLILAVFFFKCRQPDVAASVSIVSTKDKATGLIIRGVQIEESNLSKRLTIQLVQPRERTSVLGEFKVDKGEIIFEPLVPFTSGLQYEVLLDNSIFAKIEIPKGRYESPALVSIYPTQDTLPENLLKMYLHFSQPMVEGRSLNYVALIRNGSDTMKGTFLDLKPELWNAEGTILTLWLDPGRIKRDLIPNKVLGTPLHSGQEYTLYVADSWKSKNGLPLSSMYSKTFVTTFRDDHSPDLLQWTILSPPSRTRQPFEIKLPESLDYYLLKEGLAIVDSDRKLISGVVDISNEEQSFRFLPDKPWTAGNYAIQIEARLEDLAGNNLNRPFDRDVDNKTQEKDREIFIKEFEIR